MASSILGISQCVPCSKQLHHSQNNCKYLHEIKYTRLLIRSYSSCCRHSIVWNPSHYSLPQVQTLPTSSKNVATVLPKELLHVGKSILLALLMDHLFLFNRDTRGTHTMIPYAILLLNTSYLLHATALAAIYLLLPAAICFTAVFYTIDQMFCVNAEFRLTRRQGLWQVYRLLMATVAFTGAACFAASLHFLLLYSKNGQKTQSISSTVFAVFSTAFTIVAPWAIRTAVRKLQQVFNREWEAIHEERSIT